MFALTKKENKHQEGKRILTHKQVPCLRVTKNFCASGLLSLKLCCRKIYVKIVLFFLFELKSVRTTKMIRLVARKSYCSFHIYLKMTGTIFHKVGQYSDLRKPCRKKYNWNLHIIYANVHLLRIMVHHYFLLLFFYLE